MTGTGGGSLSLRGVSKRFGDVTALEPMDLDVADGELMVLVGPSGCGKTTALRIVAGLEEAGSGTVHIGGRDVTEVEPGDRDVAMVFQSYALYPHMTVRNNLAFPLKMRKRPRDEIAAAVARAATRLGLEGVLDRKPGQLSGGQRQRVALGRALVREPRIFLFDEPLSNLDAKLRAELRNEIAALHRRLAATMVFVTHDQVEAMTLGQRIAVMRDGKLQQVAAPLDVYRRPANLFVARFIGTPSINTVEGTVASGRFTGDPGRADGPAGIALDLPGAPEGPVTVAVRPESLTLGAPDAEGVTFTSVAHRVEPLGSELLVHVGGPGGGEWIVRTPPDAEVVAGGPVGVRVPGERVHVFGRDGARCPL